MIPTTTTMPRSLMRSALAAILIVCFGLATAAAAEHHEEGVPDVEYRQMVMANIGSNMGGIGAILKNRLALPGHVAVHAGQMAESAQLIGAAFKKNAPSDATDAKPEIWKDWADFESKIADFEKAALNLKTAASGKDPAAVGPAVKALGKSCGGCHKAFRKPKEESFKKASK
jgi:cytochrome c556